MHWQLIKCCKEPWRSRLNVLQVASLIFRKFFLCVLRSSLTSFVPMCKELSTWKHKDKSLIYWEPIDLFFFSSKETYRFVCFTVLHDLSAKGGHVSSCGQRQYGAAWLQQSHVWLLSQSTNKNLNLWIFPCPWLPTQIDSYVELDGRSGTVSPSCLDQMGTPTNMGQLGVTRKHERT